MTLLLLVQLPFWRVIVLLACRGYMKGLHCDIFIHVYYLSVVHWANRVKVDLFPQVIVSVYVPTSLLLRYPPPAPHQLGPQHVLDKRSIYLWTIVAAPVYTLSSSLTVSLSWAASWPLNSGAFVSDAILFVSSRPQDSGSNGYGTCALCLNNCAAVPECWSPALHWDKRFMFSFAEFFIFPGLFSSWSASFWSFF